MPIKIRIHFRNEGGIKHHKTIIIENFMISKPQLPTLLNGILHKKKDKQNIQNQNATEKNKSL